MDAQRALLAADYGLIVDAGEVEALRRLGDAPITVVNLFALRESAEYPGGEACSGVDAMLRYGATSGARLAAVGGNFVAQALPTGAVWGDTDVDWDLIVVATYPSANAFWSLLADPEYRQAFAHRRAAVARQQVLVGATL